MSVVVAAEAAFVHDGPAGCVRPQEAVGQVAPKQKYDAIGTLAGSDYFAGPDQ